MSKPMSIRSSLLRGQILLIVLLGVVLLGTTFLGTRQAMEVLLSALVERRVEHVETELRRYFQSTGSGLLAIGAWGRAGLIDADRPAELSLLLTPLFEEQPQLVGVLVADETGRGMMLAATAVGENTGGEDTGEEHTAGEDTAGEQTVEVERLPLVAAQEAGWWRGAVELLDDPARSIHITDPERTEKGVRFTGSVAFLDPEGVVTAVALQTRLEGLVDFVRGLTRTDDEAIAVLTDDFRLLALPEDRRLWAGEPGGWVLRSPSELGSSLVSEAVAAFAARPEGEEGPLRFVHRGEVWWVQLRRFPLGGERAVYISVLVPDSALAAGRFEVRLGIFVVTVIALLAALLGSYRLARRVSEPIEVLTANSERIRRGDLEPGRSVETTLREVRELAEAQERMRLGLRSLLELEGELQAARRVQQSALPRNLPQVLGWDLAAWSEPADETGGDAYDAVALGQRSSPDGALMLLADATGHGIGAALSVARLSAMVRMGARSGDDLAFLARLLNEQLCEELPSNRFVTVWLGRIDVGAGEIATLSAGQAPLLLLRRGAAATTVLAADVAPLGLRPDLPIAAPPPIAMAPGDLYVVLSDGFFEARDAAGEHLGVERLTAALERERAGTAAEILAALRAELEAFSAGTPADDDRTAVVIRRVG
ncbi:MAG TPA: SpoIIE family protein phosphatase [Thermoanaerobaculia bacterium]|nr:SpoIIE family protein phosphatase [Thermoanaerobaculia bacterium]